MVNIYTSIYVYKSNNTIGLDVISVVLADYNAKVCITNRTYRASQKKCNPPLFSLFLQNSLSNFKNDFMVNENDILVRHDTLIQCQGNYMKMKKFNYMLKIDILRISSQKNMGVLRAAF